MCSMRLIVLSQWLCTINKWSDRSAVAAIDDDGCFDCCWCYVSLYPSQCYRFVNEHIWVFVCVCCRSYSDHHRNSILCHGNDFSTFCSDFSYIFFSNAMRYFFGYYFFDACNSMGLTFATIGVCAHEPCSRKERGLEDALKNIVFSRQK